jgi:signal transduction histidine kinase
VPAWWWWRAGRRPAWSPALTDVTLAVVCFLATIAVPVKNAQARWWLVPLAICASAPLAWRRRWPITVTAAVGAGTVGLALLGGLDNVPLPYGQLAATYTFAALSSAGWRAAAVLGTALGIVALGLTAGDRISVLAVAALPFVAAYALGTGARARQEHVGMLEERAQRLAETQDAAAARERQRIARDMHDVLAHSVSLMVVQAEAGPVVVRSDPARAEAAFEAIATAGRDALSQLRRTLGVLRADGPGATDRQPQRGLDDLAELARDAGRAGLPASVVESGVRRPVPAELGIAVYRIVQESLTNTLRHAGATRAQVRLDWADGALTVQVSDDGSGPGSPPAPAGHGLIGMRERVAACGGELTTGPGGAGGAGFHVQARLPVGGVGG